MIVTKLTDAVEGTGAQDAKVIEHRGNDVVVVQAKFTGSGSVEVQGRISEEFDWFTLSVLTDSEPVAVIPTMFMRVNITANTDRVTVGVLV